MEKIILSFKQNLKGIVFVLFASLMTAFGQMFWKISNEKNLTYLIIGFVLYGIGAVLLIIAFRYGSLSVLHPMLSFGYIFAMFLGFFVLNEHITPLHLIATFIIIIGVVLVGGGDV